MRKQTQIVRSIMVIVFCMSIIAGSVPVSTSAAITESSNIATTNPYGGTDYFIDSVSGNDLNNGTSQVSPWKNVTKANATTFAPGDRILLKAGSVWENQQLWPKGSGAEGKPIVIDMYGDVSLGKPYIAINGNVSCPVTYTNGTYSKNSSKVGLTGAVVLRNQQYWEIHNLEISNDDNFNTDITNTTVVRDGINISINADLLSSGDDKIMNYFRISDCYIHDIDGPSTWQKIHYGGIVFQVFGANAYSTYAQSAYYFQDVRIENNRFYKTELHAVEFSFNWFGDSQAQYDESGKYHEGWEQLWVKTRDLYSRDVYIGHNYCESIGQGAIQLANTKNMVVEYNEVNGFLERYNAVSCGLYLWAGADSVIQYNEVYDGPYDEYDGTPWDMEYTNFNVTYQYNYSHDNKAGWMSYMGNSSNSIARYNLSVNDNGVIVKNMLSTNYAPSYFVNNVFVYDASQMDYFHDEIFKDKVYFYNNVFYNYSTTTTTPWYRRDGAFNNAVFSNNTYWEASGVTSNIQPRDNYAIMANPQFVENPVNYKRDLGVDNILQAAAVYKLAATSPLIDAGHYVTACGTIDFFSTDLYYGEGIDIGICEVQAGTKVENPVEVPLEPTPTPAPNEKVNLVLGKTATANYTHPRGDLGAEKLIDGSATTRWACCDPSSMSAGYPIEITIDFATDTTFDEVFLDEYTDSGTNLRISNFELQSWNGGTQSWETFKSVVNGMGHNFTLNDFGTVTSSKLRLKITSQLSSEYYTPTMTEIQVYLNTPEQVETNPVLLSSSGTYSLSNSGAASNIISMGINLDNDVVSEIAYYGSEGNKLRTLYAGTEYTVTNNVYTINNTFLQTLNTGNCTIRFIMNSGKILVYSLTVTE